MTSKSSIFLEGYTITDNNLSTTSLQNSLKSFTFVAEHGTYAK